MNKFEQLNQTLDSGKKNRKIVIVLQKRKFVIQKNCFHQKNDV